MCFSHLLFNLRTGGIKIILAIILREDWVPSSGPGGLPMAPPWPRQDLAFPFSSGRVGQREDPRTQRSALGTRLQGHTESGTESEPVSAACPENSLATSLLALNPLG